MFCKECECKLDEGVRFCKNCGKKVENEDNMNNDSFFVSQDFYEPTIPAKKQPENYDSYSNFAPECNSFYNAPVQQPPMQSSNYDDYQRNPQPQPQIIVTPPVQVPYTPQYKPISAWGYFGYNLLFSIPLVGFICLIIFSLSSDNINRRNFARSFWCWIAIGLILGAIFGVLILISGGELLYELENILDF